LTNLPIIFIHTGNQNYLKIAIESAIKFGNDVHLIGDEANRGFCEKWCHIDSLTSKLYEDFKKYYVHMSTNSYEFELMCFKRYFLAYEYLKQIGAEKFVMLDSDILTYTNYETLPFVSEYAIAASWFENQNNYKWSVCPCMFMATIDALRDYLVFMINTYSQAERLSLLREKEEYHKQNNIPGGICDMTLLFLWIKDCEEKKKYRVHNNAIIENGIAFDHNIQTASGFIKNEFQYDNFLRMKKVIYKDNIPFFVLKDGGKVRANTLHFLGGAKTAMLSFYYNKSYISKLFNRYKLRLLSSPKRANNKVIRLLKSKGNTNEG
jgi:hypothetical protein